MMKVKKYRAATTREALEQIKQDLGEDAFVLETKQVRTGGFLRFQCAERRSRSARPMPEFADKPAAENSAKSTIHSNYDSNLTDDTVAAPQSRY